MSDEQVQGSKLGWILPGITLINYWQFTEGVPGFTLFVVFAPLGVAVILVATVEAIKETSKG